MESVNWVQTLDEAVCISYHTKDLEKGINSYVLPFAMGK